MDRPARLTLTQLRAMRDSGRHLSMLTCYDATFAALLDECEVDMLLVGDSLGMVIQGLDSTLPVQLDDMVYHTRAVHRGSSRAWIVADLPFGSYQANAAQAFATAVRLMQAGANMVKLEGGGEIAETVEFLSNRGIPVCAHIGLKPQHVNQLGGYRVQGKTSASAQTAHADALRLSGAGAAMLLMEGLYEPVARAICADLDILTIGIGASHACDAQVLVLHDMLGLGSGIKPRFVKNFMTGATSIAEAVRAYVNAVGSNAFPAAEHLYGDVRASKDESLLENVSHGGHA